MCTKKSIWQIAKLATTYIADASVARMNFIAAIATLAFAASASMNIATAIIRIAFNNMPIAIWAVVSLPKGWI